jgi:hypothetical protein
VQGDNVDFTFSNPPIAFDDFDISIDEKLRNCFFALRASYLIALCLHDQRG